MYLALLVFGAVEEERAEWTKGIESQLFPSQCLMVC
jgi:hypothetical protein